MVEAPLGKFKHQNRKNHRGVNLNGPGVASQNKSMAISIDRHRYATPAKASPVEW